MELSANLSFLYKETTFLDRIRAAASSGFRGVEFGAPVIAQHSKEELIAAKDAAGVEVVTICGALGGQNDKGLAAMPGREEDFKRTVSTAVLYASALKCPRIHFLCGAFPRELQQTEALWIEAEATYISNLKFAAQECSKCSSRATQHGITVLIEAISTIPNYFLRYQGQAISIIEQVACSNVKLLFDFYHAQTLCGNLCDFLTKNISIIDHIQVAQVPGRHEPDQQGEINYSFVFNTLKSLGYKGWIGCEYVPKVKSWEPQCILFDIQDGTTEDGLRWAAPFLKKK